MTLSLIRFGLLSIFLLGLGGTSAELLLLSHTEKVGQFVPLVALGLGLIIVAWYIVSRSATALKSFRWMMGLFVVVAFTGVILHFLGNVEFELKKYPDLSGLSLFWSAITSRVPALAPGTMVLLGLIGWLFTFRNPRLTPKKPHAADLQSHPSTDI